jgi:hypothetical protein
MYFRHPDLAPVMPMRHSTVLARTVLLVIVGSVVLPALLHAQTVTVSPMSVVLDSRTRSSTLTLYNSSAAAAEVTVDLAFGYPQSDGEGNVTVPLTSEPAADEPSAFAWMRVFPKRFVLEAGARQVVRIMAEPPPALPDGEYWSRVIVASRAVSAPLERPAEKLEAKLNIVTRMVTPANYRQGAVTTGVEVTRATATRDGGGIRLEFDLRRTGNAAYLGRLQADVVDARGAVLASAREDLAVYRTLTRRIAIDVPAGAGDPSEVRLTIDSVRDDVPPGVVLKAPPVTQKVRIDQ